MKEKVSEKDIYEIMDALLVAIVVIDSEFRIEYVNQAFQALWCMEDDHCVGKGDLLTDLCDAEACGITADTDRTKWQENTHNHFSRLLEEEVTSQIYYREDEKKLTYSVRKLDNESRLISYFDLTKGTGSKTAKLSSNKESPKLCVQLAEAIEALEDGFSLFDSENRLVHCNQAFKNILEDIDKTDDLIQDNNTQYNQTHSMVESAIPVNDNGQGNLSITPRDGKQRKEIEVKKLQKTSDGRWLRQRETVTPSGEIVSIQTDITEEKKWELQLHEAKEILDTMSDAVPHGILIFREENIQFYNAKLIELFECKPDDVFVGQSLESYVEVLVNSSLVGKRNDVLTNIKNNIKHKENYTIERKTRSGRIVRIDGVSHSSGLYVYTFIEITRDKEVLHLLEQRKEMLDLALSVSDNAILVSNGFDEIITYNEQAYQFLDLKIDDTQKVWNYHEILQLQYDQRIFKELDENDITKRDFVNGAIRTTLAAQQKPKLLFLKNGEVLRYRVKQLDNGYLVHSYIKITNEITREQEVQKNRDLLESILASSENALLITDQEYNLLEYNQRFLEMTDFKVDEISQCETLDDVFHFIYKKKGLKPFHKLDVPFEVFLKAAHQLRDLGEKSPQTLYLANGMFLRYRVRQMENGYIVHSYIDITTEQKHVLALEQQQKLLKEAKRETEIAAELQHNTAEAMSSGLIVVVGEEIVSVNKAAKELLEVDEDVLAVGMSWRESLSKQSHNFSHENPKSCIENLLFATNEQKSFQTTKELITGRVLRIDALPYRDKGMIYTFTDITDMKRREEELQASKTKTERALTLVAKTSRSMPQGLVVMRGNKIEHVNPALYEIFGITQNDVYPGQTFEDYLRLQIDELYLDIDEEFEVRAKKCILEAKPYEAERQTKNGKTLKVFVKPDSDGITVMTYTDITSIKDQQRELERALTELHKSKETFQAFAEANSDWFWKADKDLRFTFLSEEFTQFANLSKDLLIGKSPSEVPIPGTSPENLAHYVEKMNAREPFRDLLLNRVNSEGDPIWFSIGGTPVFDNSGTFEGYVGSARDVTDNINKQLELEAAKKEAELAERAKSEFLANMSHEIRTPMNGVLGMAELLTTTSLDDRQRMFTDVIVKSGNSLLTIINDILDFSKIDAGQMELSSEPFNLREAVEDVATLVSTGVTEKGLELIVRFNPDLPERLIGDAGRVRQIITNLLGNAVKFTEKGHVYVNVDGHVDETNSALLHLSVKDTGIGIPQEKCRHIFQKFSQVDTSATREHEGTGLGLSIASSLIELMGGEISVTSEVGVGSKFELVVKLPVAEPSTQTPMITPKDLVNSRVVVIDDNSVNRSILLEQLTNWNFDVATASSGPEGLDLLNAAQQNNIEPDLIVLDYQMPNMSGADVLTAIRSTPETQHLPVIILTSADNCRTDIQLKELSVQAILNKPARSSLLFNTIMRVISNTRINTENNAPIITTEETDQLSRKDNSNEKVDVLIVEDNEVHQITFTQILESLKLTYKLVESGKDALHACKTTLPDLIMMDLSIPDMDEVDVIKAIRKQEREKSSRNASIIGISTQASEHDIDAYIAAGMNDYLCKPVAPDKMETIIRQWLDMETNNPDQQQDDEKILLFNNHNSLPGQ